MKLDNKRMAKFGGLTVCDFLTLSTYYVVIVGLLFAISLPAFVTGVYGKRICCCAYRQVQRVDDVVGGGR